MGRRGIVRARTSPGQLADHDVQSPTLAHLLLAPGHAGSLFSIADAAIIAAAEQRQPRLDDQNVMTAGARSASVAALGSVDRPARAGDQVAGPGLVDQGMGARPADDAAAAGLDGP
jgi:hypothetical protein